MEDDKDEIEVKTPAGSLRARGTDLLGLITVLGICAILFLTYQNGLDAKASNIQVVSTIQKMVESQIKYADTQEELSYLISLTPEQRTRLKMEMPASLRKRLSDR